MCQRDVLAKVFARAYHRMLKTVTTSEMTVCAVAEWVGGTVDGDGRVSLRGLAAIDQAGPDDLTFAADQQRVNALRASKAGAAIVPRDAAGAAIPLIRVDDVNVAVARLLARLAPAEDLPPAGVHRAATVAPDAQVAPDAAIGPGAVVGAGAKIGAGAVLCANVVVETQAEIGEGAVLFPGVVVGRGCKLGRRVRVGPNSSIGFEGFGYYQADGAHQRIRHAGTVVIEDDVDLGACACVDRAKFGATTIGAGTKVDNLVQIAHNVQIGRGCLLVSLVGVAGSVRLGDYVVLGGHTGVRDGVRLGDGVQCGAYSAIAGDIAAGEKILGVPAGPADQEKRTMIARHKVPDLLRRVKELEARLSALESSKNH
jgi:UDP-3-O-[3-hydroxymyristoyl] glucosamine N-acyltransferase